MRPSGLAVLLIIGIGCSPDIKKSPPSNLVHARFDPSQPIPVLPSPNDLAINPATGRVSIPAPPNASAADLELISYLSTLDGFPADSSLAASFDGLVDLTRISANAIRVFDVTAGNAAVSNLVVGAKVVNYPGAQSELDIAAPSAGWTPGHTYAVALIGGGSGLIATNGFAVAGTPTWAFVRARNSLVTCPDLKTNCQPTSSLLPSTAAALQLEQLRLKYKPFLDYLDTQGIPREQIPLLWTFKVANAVTLSFQPGAPVPQIPIPTDLAMNPVTGTLAIPVSPLMSPAQQEFTRDYLDNLNGYPVATAGDEQVAGGDLVAASVTAPAVQVLDITPMADGGTNPPPAVTLAYDPTLHQVDVVPPSTGWIKGHHYAAFIVTGSTGVQGANSLPVDPSEVWVLARGSAPVATCANPGSAGCTSELSIVSLSSSDAAQLEQIRQGYAPLLQQLNAMGIPSSAVGVLWTFTIMSQAEATFDPVNAVIPFPNDLALLQFTDGGTRVNVPGPDGGVPTSADCAAAAAGGNQQVQLICGLNSLDGFSTTAPLVTENSNPLAALSDNAVIDPTTLDAGTGVMLLASGSNAPTQPVVAACLSTDTDSGCAQYFSTFSDGGIPNNPQQLVLAPQVPFDERSHYAAYVTTGVKDTTGKPVAPSVTFALMRMSNSLLDSNGHSTVPGVTDAQATALEPLRVGFKPAFDALALAGIPRSKLALGWSFTTQTELTALKALHDLPANPAAPLPTSVIDFPNDQSAFFGADAGTMPHVRQVLSGELLNEFALTGPGGTLNPTAPVVQRVHFIMAIPWASPPTGGYPVVIFGHGLGGWREHDLAIADTLATPSANTVPEVTIATDVIWHGDRSSCAGSAAATGSGSDNLSCFQFNTTAGPAICDETTTSPTYGRCIAATAANRASCTTDLNCENLREGRCLSGGVCEGGDFLRDSDLGLGATDLKPVISGWNMLSISDLFGMRDNFRQQVIDLAQLVRVLQATGTGSLSSSLNAPLNLNAIHYVGQSLGGILGTLYNGAANDTHHVMLNVPGGNLLSVLLNSSNTTIAADRAALFQQLGAAGMPQGSPQFDQFLRTGQWILDPADPVNAAYGLTHQALASNPLPNDRKAFIQYVQYDETVPNVSTNWLIAAANRPNQTAMCTVNMFDPAIADVPLGNRHGFLLQPPTSSAASLTMTATAQLQADVFTANGTAPSGTTP